MECPVCHTVSPEDSDYCGRCGTRITKVVPGANPATTITLPLSLLQLTRDEIVAGKYRIIDRIGMGGMGVVFKAEDIRLKRYVALKFLRPEYLIDEDAKHRFLIEAQAAAAIDHPHICAVFEIDEYKNQTFSVMPFIEGESIKQMLLRGALEPKRATKFAAEIAEGLAEAHEHGIVHRDIKAANVMINKSGQAKIMDFGLAKLMEAADATTSMKVMGTLAYMSPEQARGGAIDHRTDIWSLGVLLYEMLSKRLPFEAQHSQAILFSICHEQPKPLRQEGSQIPTYLEMVVDRCLRKDPAERFQTARELIATLSRAADADWHVPDRDDSAEISPRRRPGSRLLLFGIPGILTATVGLFLLGILKFAPDRGSLLGGGVVPINKTKVSPSTGPPSPESGLAIIEKTGLPGTFVIQGGRDRGIARGACGRVFSASAETPVDSTTAIGECVVVEVFETTSKIELISPDEPVRAGDSVQLYTEARGFLSISAEPKEAELYLDDGRIGRSPVKRILAPGAYRLRVVAKGYAEISETISLDDHEIEFRPYKLTALPPPPPKQGSILLESDPPGATIYQDGDPAAKGKTPLQLTASPGNHRFLLRKDNYREFEIRAEILDGQIAYPRTAVLPPLEGSLDVKTNPPGADIWINGRLVESQKTPLSLRLPAAKYKVELRKEGYERRESDATITADAITPIEVSLQPVAKPVYFITINSKPQGALLYVNDLLRGLTPKEVEVEGPRVKIKLEKDGYKIHEEDMTLKASTTETDFALQPVAWGKVTITASDPVTYVIDEGKQKGRFPSQRTFELPEGKHEIEFTFEDGTKLHMPLNIRPNQDIKVHGLKEKATFEKANLATYEIRGGPDVTIELPGSETMRVPPQRTIRTEEGPKEFRFTVRDRSGSPIRILLSDQIVRSTKKRLNLSFNSTNLSPDELRRLRTEYRGNDAQDILIIHTAGTVGLEVNGADLGNAVAEKDIIWHPPTGKELEFRVRFRSSEASSKAEISIHQMVLGTTLKINLSIDRE